MYNLQDPCKNCYDQSCLDGYQCPPLDEYCKYNGETYYVYDTKGKIMVEKLEKNYRVLLYDMN